MGVVQATSELSQNTKYIITLIHLSNITIFNIMIKQLFIPVLNILTRGEQSVVFLDGNDICMLLSLTELIIFKQTDHL